VFFGNIITKTPGFYQEIKAQAYGFVPSTYNQQWQKAMQWVRDETPKQAVFSHWWDYGYWVQSIGNRATVLDGGNAISYWNYLMGRLVLTGDNQADALEFLYNHNATHLLIDSSDIGKYGAFSSIGSDKELDRYSWMAAFLLDEKQIQETKNQTILVYPGGISLDEDLIIEQDGKEILLPRGGAGIGAIIIPVQKKNETQTNFEQPYVIAVYQGQQYKVYIRYLAIQGGFNDFKSGINASAYVFPTLIVQGAGGVNSNPIGAAVYLSPRLMRGMLAQTYILNDPLKNFPNFKLVHSEPNIIIDSLNQQGMNLPEFIYYQGIQGPIKIWEIEYTGKEEIRQDYLDTDATKYLDWGL
jgi:asparagine N-glycosylation enzyme membrane subunit Stt3